MALWNSLVLSGTEALWVDLGLSKALLSSVWLSRPCLELVCGSLGLSEPRFSEALCGSRPPQTPLSFASNSPIATIKADQGDLG